MGHLQSNMVELTRKALVLGGEYLDKMQRVTSHKQNEERSTHEKDVKLEAVDSISNNKPCDRKQNDPGSVQDYGRFVGDALESASDGNLSHDDALIWGMRCSAVISHRLGYLSYESLLRHDKILYRLGTPDIPFPVPHANDVINHLLSRCKDEVEDGPVTTVPIVLLRDKKKPVPENWDCYHASVPISTLREALFKIWILPNQSLDRYYNQQMFSVVEIEVNSDCNRKCKYCPVSVLSIPRIPQRMSEDIFDRIINELSRINFTGRLSYHFYNEPLLRRDLDELVEQVTEHLPGAFQVLYTNGDFLSEERYDGLKTAGIGHFIVTLHDGSMTIPERRGQSILSPSDLQLTNRGGILEGFPPVTEDARNLPCLAPDEMLIVMITGDIILCYEDVERKTIMGNIMEHGIDEIWFSKKFIELRRILGEGNRLEAGSLCNKCTNRAHNVPGNSFFAL